MHLKSNDFFFLSLLLPPLAVYKKNQVTFFPFHCISILLELVWNNHLIKLNHNKIHAICILKNKNKKRREYTEKHWGELEVVKQILYCLLVQNEHCPCTSRQKRNELINIQWMKSILSYFFSPSLYVTIVPQKLNGFIVFRKVYLFFCLHPVKLHDWINWAFHTFVSIYSNQIAQEMELFINRYWIFAREFSLGIHNNLFVHWQFAS